MKRCWKRILTVELSNNSNKYVFGDNPVDNLTITVAGHKYMSALKDACTITIANLTYTQILRILNDKFYKVEVKAGYEYGDTTKIFKGEVLWISNRITDNKTNEVIILCASSLIARYSQQRLNFSLQSGINMYSAIKYVTSLYGIQHVSLSDELKSKVIKAGTIKYNVATWLDDVAKQSGYSINTDEILGSTVSIYDLSSKRLPVIKLDPNNLDLSCGFPSINKSGVVLNIIPSYNFTCGTCVQIPNDIINLGVNSVSSDNMSLGYYLDPDGIYLIYQIDYNLQNRGEEFSLSLYTRARSLLSNFIGGNN